MNGKQVVDTRIISQRVWEIIQKPSEADTNHESRWNDLRFGIELCELMNALSPGSVAHFQRSKGVNEAVENLKAFINGRLT